MAIDVRHSDTGVSFWIHVTPRARVRVTGPGAALADRLRALASAAESD